MMDWKYNMDVTLKEVFGYNCSDSAISNVNPIFIRAACAAAEIESLSALTRCCQMITRTNLGRRQ